MSFDKNYPNRKDKRKEYKDSRSFDRSCRNHGSCPYCTRNRVFFSKKAALAAEEALKDYEEEE